MTNSDIIKKGMIEALTKSLGIVSTACDAMGISRQTHYRWLSEDNEYKDQVENISEAAIDFAESKLYEKINGITIQTFNSKGEPQIYEQAPSDTAIIFYLKTKGKKRGYIEKSEIDQKTEHSGQISHTIDHSKLSDAALREIASLDKPKESKD